MKKSRFFLAVISLFVAITSSAQNISVTGVVTDASTGEPIPFAFCQVKGSTKGSSSDADGRYSIPVPSDGTIIFSSMGYEQKEVAVKGKTTINVALTPDSQLLEGVVVTGMQKMDRRLFTGSTAKLDAESAKIDGLTDVSRSLEGRVAGVSVQNVSGTFGTAPKIRVRGATSIYGSSKPLWVVDGVIMEDVVDVSADQLSSGDASTLISSAIAGLNSDDIESFDILKGYGRCDCRHDQEGPCGIVQTQLHRRVHNKAQTVLPHVQHNELAGSDGNLPGTPAEGLP